MSCSFTVLWNSDRVRIAKSQGLLGREVPFLFGGPHTSQPSFIRAGVKEGDFVYPIFVKAGVIHILAEVLVREFTSTENFVGRRPDLYPPERTGAWHGATLENGAHDHPWLRAFHWTCSDHVLIPERSSALS